MAKEAGRLFASDNTSVLLKGAGSGAFINIAASPMSGMDKQAGLFSAAGKLLSRGAGKLLGKTPQVAPKLKTVLTKRVRPIRSAAPATSPQPGRLRKFRAVKQPPKAPIQGAPPPQPAVGSNRMLGPGPAAPAPAAAAPAAGTTRSYFGRRARARRGETVGAKMRAKNTGTVAQGPAPAPAPTQAGTVAKGPAAATQAGGTVAAGPAAAEPGRGIMSGAWKHRRSLATAGALGGAYGLYKGVPWAARQLEQSSHTPTAYGGGWSPINYGYGQNPYGAGMPNMGYGA